MDFVYTLGGGAPRSGRHERVNNDRYIHVPGQGWYALTREGLGGPFENRQQAEIFVAGVLAGEIVPEPQDKKHVSK